MDFGSLPSSAASGTFATPSRQLWANEQLFASDDLIMSHHRAAVPNDLSEAAGWLSALCFGSGLGERLAS